MFGVDIFDVIAKNAMKQMVEDALRAQGVNDPEQIEALRRAVEQQMRGGNAQSDRAARQLYEALRTYAGAQGADVGGWNDPF